MKDEPPSRVLLLMRHGKAENGDTPDIKRPLSEKGQEQARVVGRYLRSQGITPSAVLLSSSTRTKETWKELNRELEADSADVTVLKELYLGGSNEVLRSLDSLDSSHKVVLVVAHEPTMSQLAAHLANDETSETAALAQVRIGVPTGSMSVLTSTSDSWSHIEPEELTLRTLVRG